MSQTTELPGRRALPIYLLIWGLLAAAALAYLGLLALRPELAARPFTRSPSDAETLLAVAKAMDEMRVVRKTTTDTKTEIAEVRAQVETQQARYAEFLARLAALEQRQGQPHALPQAQAGARAAPPPIITGSVTAIAAPAAEIAFGQAEVKRAEPMALQLGAAPTVEALRLQWTLISDRYRNQVKALEPRYVAGGDGGPFTLIAGPLGSAEEAGRACTQLRARKVACTVTRFGGDPLN